MTSLPKIITGLKKVLTTGLMVCSLNFSHHAHAASSKKVCATYENSGHNYRVSMELLKGQELNEKTHSYTYNTYDQYGAIFWQEGQVTLIDFENSFCGESSFGSCDGTDQQDHHWNVNFNSFSLYSCE